jgi:hypothetical protein
MNEKNQVTLRDVGILFHGIPYTRSKLPYEPFITLVIDKHTRCILGCSICETRAEKNDRNRAPQLEARSADCVLNGIRSFCDSIMPPYKNPHPSPKNPLSGEAWRQRGHRFPRD